MTKNEILNLKKCVVYDTKKKSVNFSVYMVARACFNDEMLVESLTLKIEDINDKPLYWFDLFLGRKKDNTTRIAVAYIDCNDVYLLKDDGCCTEVVKAQCILASEDFNDSYIISTHIW